jgi:hypothetical protein
MPQMPEYRQESVNTLKKESWVEQTVVAMNMADNAEDLHKLFPDWGKVVNR